MLTIWNNKKKTVEGKCSLTTGCVSDDNKRPWIAENRNTVVEMCLFMPIYH